MLELCMFAEGSRYQEEISAMGPKGKIECLVPGPGRFWPAHLGAPPVPKVIVSPRTPAGPVELDIPVDPALLTFGIDALTNGFQLLPVVVGLFVLFGAGSIVGGIRSVAGG